MYRPTAIAVLLLGSSTVAAAEVPAMPSLSADECAVWTRELGFARSVAEHDAVAFADHVAAQAAFNASEPQPIRGREAIVQRWTGLISGKKVRLSWYPTRVTVGGVQDVAWSSGPALLEDLDPAAKDRYLMTGFRSVWHKDDDGVWRVLFDDGAEPKPASAAEAAAFEQGRRDCAVTAG